MQVSHIVAFRTKAFQLTIRHFHEHPIIPLCEIAPASCKNSPIGMRLLHFEFRLL